MTGTDQTAKPADETATPEVDLRYRDAGLPIEERVENLLGQMSLEEKAGLFFQTMMTIGEGGAVAGPNPAFGIADSTEMIRDRHMTHFNVFGAASSAAEMAEWHNRVQEVAASTRLGIPVTFSTDPRHSFSDNPLAAMMAGPFSQWPETMGLAAIGDEELVERFADIARQEYTAVGIRVALHPQIDLATEPRWARQSATFGEDPELTSRLGAAYIRGFQGSELGPDSVATMTKHFPGGGPQKDGEDPHFPYGREQVYPGGRFETHLKPFEAAFEAGASQIMPYYGMPVGTEYEEVGFGFNKSVITGLLRERYGFDGIVCTDWGLIKRRRDRRRALPGARLGRRAPVAAGADASRSSTREPTSSAASPSPNCSSTWCAAVELAEERLDVSARRLLREKFRLGLFDAPKVDPARAAAIVGNAEFVAAGEAAQRASVTLLKNEATLLNEHLLPLTRGAKVLVRGFDPEVVAGYATVVDRVEDADVALVRLHAPYEQRSTMFENFFHAGSLDFAVETVDEVVAIARAVPTVVQVFLDRPAILTPIAGEVRAIAVDYGASAVALLDVLFGEAAPQGRLPMDLPSSMAAVVAGRPDVPFDTADPLFRFGHGLRY